MTVPPDRSGGVGQLPPLTVSIVLVNGRPYVVNQTTQIVLVDGVPYRVESRLTRLERVSDDHPPTTQD